MNIGQVIIPFFEYIALQFVVIIIGTIVVKEKELNATGVMRSWVLGQMLLFALLQFMTVPMIFLRCSFYTLFWSYCGICATLIVFGSWRIKKYKIHVRIEKPNLSPFALLLLMVTVLLILWQSSTYFFGIHLDEDDARWLAQANDAIEYGDMMTRGYDTGEFLGVIEIPKDATSPWPMLIAVISKILGISTSVFAHTIYPSVEIAVLYSIYWIMGVELYEKTETRLTFVLIAVVLNLFLGLTVYTQSTFSLVRIWQGKADVAGIIIPLLFYHFIRINKQDTTFEWVRLMIVCFASCLMSGMGISLSAIVIFTLGIYHILAYHNWRRIPMLVVSISPSVVYLLTYTAYKSLF